MAGFKLPEVEHNEFGWGPTSVPEQYKDVPFMPYSKSERLGRIADFGQQSGYRGYQNRFRDREPLPGTSVFNFERQDADESFEMVDTRVTKKHPGGPQRGRGGGRGWAQGGRDGRQDGGRGGRDGGRGGWGGRGGPGGRGGGRGWGNRDAQRAQYSSSVDVRPDWAVLGDVIPLPALSKAVARGVGEAETLKSLGSLPLYDKAADRVVPKAPAKLRRLAGPPRAAPTAWADPVLRALAEAESRDAPAPAQDAADEAPAQPPARTYVYTTDDVLAAVMTSPRSVLPWDVALTRRGAALWLDRRPGSSLERLSNAETAPDAIAEDEAALNGVQQLSAESTAVHAALAAQVLLPGGGQSAKVRDAAARRLGDSLPEALQRGGGQVDGGYVYRRWTVSPSLTLTVRCNVPGLVEVGDSLQRVAVHALNEFDPKWSGVDWRAKLDSQRGAVLATELKNNAAKMARWTVAALLGGVDLIKLGYLSRVLVKDASNHVLLGTQTVKPRDFAAQMNLSLDNAWGVARTLLELVAAKGRRDGVYLLVKDPNKPQLRLYALPTGGLDARAAAAEEADEDITLAPGQDD